MLGDTILKNKPLKKQLMVQEILRKNGLAQTLYIPTVGVQDLELRKILQTFTGYIITDSQGQLVGKMCYKPTPATTTRKKQPRLRLVVSNK